MNLKRAATIFSVFAVIVMIIIVSVLYENRLGFKATSAQSDEKSPVFIIDAGHGGLDGGTSSSDGLLEKDINLEIALRLDEMLRFFGYKTVMTRTNDTSLHDANAKTIRAQKTSDLHNRMKIMDSTPDAVLISIHQNHYSESKYNGAQVFYAPSSERSKALAQCVQQSIVTQLQPENARQIKPSGASIYILYKAKIPAIMVECGFLSNHAETQKLKTSVYRTEMAFAVFGGILNSEEV